MVSVVYTGDVWPLTVVFVVFVGVFVAFSDVFEFSGDFCGFLRCFRQGLVVYVGLWRVLVVSFRFLASCFGGCPLSRIRLSLAPVLLFLNQARISSSRFGIPSTRFYTKFSSF